MGEIRDKDNLCLEGVCAECGKSFSMHRQCEFEMERTIVLLCPVSTAEYVKKEFQIGL